jgi:protein-tyrosine phosphatase
MSEAASLILAISDALNAGKSVAIHCRQAVGRSGLIAAGVLESSGLDPERAIQMVSSSRGQEIPETSEQRSWIQRFAAQRPVMTH